MSIKNAAGDLLPKAALAAIIGFLGYHLWQSWPGAASSDSNQQSAVLESGQEITGDFEVLGLEQVRERSGLVGAMNVSIEKYPEELRRLLSEEGVDPNMRLTYDSGGWAHPLEKAVRQGTQETFEILLESGSDPNGQSSSGDTAMHVAARKGYLGPLKMMIERGGDPSIVAENLTEAHQRAKAEYDLEPGVGSSVMERAAWNGQGEIVGYLLELGVETRYALHAAAHKGSLEIVQMLLDHGADPALRTGYDTSALRGPGEKGFLEVARTLLDAGATPCEMAVRGAAQNGHVGLLRLFAEHGVEFADAPKAWDPLYTAAYAGQRETVELLLGLGAKPFSGDDNYPGVIQAAIDQGHREIADLIESR